MRLLCVDWDFFFPNKLLAYDPDLWQLYDWSHQESPLFIEGLWSIRAAGFLRLGLELPGLSGQQETFWDRIKVSPETICYIAESNSNAISPVVAQDVGEVWLFDAHHDAGYRQDEDPIALIRNGVYNCENWMLYYAMSNVSCHVRYPQWHSKALDIEPVPKVDIDRRIDDGQPLDQVFDRIFICRSGAWVPPWLDHHFFDFVGISPAEDIEEIGGYELYPRDFSETQSKKDAQAFNELLAKHA